MLKVEIGDSYLPLLDGTLDDCRFVLSEGPRGTAKTRAYLTIILCRALAWPGSRFGLFRSTRTRLTESVLVTLEQQVFPAFGMAVPGGAGRENRHSYPLPNGSTIIPIGMDDYQRSQSVELAGAYVAEGVEIPQRMDVEALAGAMRQAGVPFHQCLIDCNPGPPGHWLNQAAEPVPKHWRRVTCLADYQRLLDHARRPPPAGFWKRIVTRHQDNPGYFDAQKWDWTEAGRKYLDTLGNLTGHLRRRWLDGDWVSAEGTVYPEFDEDKHVVDPFPIPQTWPHFLFYDPGYDHPTAILWVAVGPNGCYYVVDEIYQGGLGVEAHAADVMKHNRANPGRHMLRYYGDPQHAFNETAQSPESIAVQFKKKTGLNLVPWPRMSEKGAKEASVNAVRRRLIGWPPQGKPNDPAQPMLKVFRTCRNTIGEFQRWSYKRMADGQLPAGDDQFEDRDNHAMDCLCGAAALNLRFNQQGIIVIDPDKPHGV